MYDGINERENVSIGFDKDEIKYVNPQTSREDDGEVIAEGDNIVVTLAFIDSNSHIGLQRSAEYHGQYEENEQMDPFTPLANALHSIYVDDPMFKESIEQL